MSAGSRFYWSFAALVAMSIAGRVAAQTARPGEVQRLTAITISMQVGSTEKETKRVTYTPPPGWYVRSHQVHCKKKFGNSSFTVTTVPRDWGFTSEEKANESYKTLVDLAGQSGHTGLKGRFALEQEQSSADRSQVHSTHHALVADATAKGEGFLRGGGGIELTVTAELVFVGVEERTDKVVPEPAARKTDGRRERVR